LPVFEYAAIPASFSRVVEMAYNLWWAWHPTGRNLWSNLDPVAWETTHNPIDIISSIDRSRWQVLEQIEAVQNRYRMAVAEYDRYMSEPNTWFARQATEMPGPVAYLCTEFGVHVSLPFYSGGLGILAGDHTKSASDLGIPLVGVGLLYRRGYFHQEIEAGGEQQHIYPALDMRSLPVLPVASPVGGQLKVAIEFPGRSVAIGVWKLQVGRVPLLLLDSDLAENDPADRPITHTLYVRGREMRLCQELILGVGAVRALSSLDIEPSVWHVNEGHAAMSVLERVRLFHAEGLAVDEACKKVKEKTAFTLHTPVPAGNEVFETSLAFKYLEPWAGQLGLDIEGLGEMATSHGDLSRFDLGALAIRNASVVNGVSQRHADVATKDWQHLIGGPAIAITNGVHAPTWIGREAGRLLSSIFGRTWPSALLDEPDWFQRILEPTDDEIWKTHLTRKEIMVRFARGRLRRQFARHGVSPDELRAIDSALPVNRLTLGFARRFATYKRATLMFTDIERLAGILTNPQRPIQVVFAGKAHPADRPAQDLIRRIVELSRGELAGHMYVLEDYDARVARFMVQGCDVWVNNPRPPMEASGTSGMKAAMNGTLNLSVLDGWWAEAFNGKNGWVFGSPHANDEHENQDRSDASSFYDVLEHEVAPLYYDRGEDEYPEGWLNMMKESAASSLIAFSSHRMVRQYMEMAYLPLSVGRA
jgi:glycogen phosphorylase